MRTKVIVLGEYIDHHVKEEEGEMFPTCRKSTWIWLRSARIDARKAELMDEMGAIA